MKGQEAGRECQLLYSFSLEARATADHLLRGIDQFVDLSALRRHVASNGTAVGRPAADDPDAAGGLLSWASLFARFTTPVAPIGPSTTQDA